MEPETPVWKWTAAAIGVIVVCFCLGYFVLGPTARPVTPGQVAFENTRPINSPPAEVVERTAAPRANISGPVVLIKEKTEELEAKRKKAEEDRKKKEADEEKKRREKEAADNEDNGGDPAAAGGPAIATTAQPDPDDLPATTPTGTTPDPAKPPTEGSDPPPATTEGSTPSAPSTPVETPTAPPAAAGSGTLFRVRVGTFASRENAQNLAAELNGRGYASSVQTEKAGGKTLYRIQVGAYRDEKRARDLQKELQANGYDSTLVK